LGGSGQESPLRKRSGEDCDLRDARDSARREVRDRILRGEVVPYRCCGVKKNSVYSRALGGCSDQTNQPPTITRTDSLRSVSRRSLEVLITGSTPKKPKKNSLTLSSVSKSNKSLSNKKPKTHTPTSKIFSFEEDPAELDFEIGNFKKSNLYQNLTHNYKNFSKKNQDDKFKSDLGRDSGLNGIGGRLADIDETEEAGFECVEENLKDKILKLRVGEGRFYRILYADLMVIDENRIFGILLSRGEGGVEHLASDSKFLG
jgi:hypothetical protein